MTFRKQSGASLLELAVSGVVIGVLAVVLLDRLLRYQELAEKTVMETTVVNMKSGLRLKLAELVMRQRLDEIGRLSQENPITWLEAPPRNYAGELDHPGQKPVPPGSWYYDKGSRELVYLPDRSRRFEPGPDGEKAIRFRVTAAGKAPAKPESVAITPVNSYNWPVF